MKELAQEQLRLLAERLQGLRSRVRDAVASEIGKAVADGVATVLTGTLATPPAFPRPGSAYGRSRWDERGWVDASGRRHDEDEDESSANPIGPAALAFAFSAGRWWLLQKRSPWGAAGVALAVGGAMLTGGPITRTVLGVLWTMHKLVGTTEKLNFDHLADEDL